MTQSLNQTPTINLLAEGVNNRPEGRHLLNLNLNLNLSLFFDLFNTN